MSVEERGRKRKESREVLGSLLIKQLSYRKVLENLHHRLCASKGE